MKKLSELISELQEKLANEGDIAVFTGDMKPPMLEVCETTFSEDVLIYGKRHLFIGENR